MRWDEDVIAGAKEMQRRERQERRMNPSALGRDSRRSTEGRKRTTIAEVFPEVQTSDSEKRRSVESSSGGAMQPPVVTVDNATSYGHGEGNATPKSLADTHVKRARPRPVSEQLLGRSRPKPIMDDANGKW